MLSHLFMSGVAAGAGALAAKEYQEHVFEDMLNFVASQPSVNLREAFAERFGSSAHLFDAIMRVSKVCPATPATPDADVAAKVAFINELGLKLKVPKLTATNFTTSTYHKIWADQADFSAFVERELVPALLKPHTPQKVTEISVGTLPASSKDQLNFIFMILAFYEINFDNK